MGRALDRALKVKASGFGSLVVMVVIIREATVHEW